MPDITVRPAVPADAPSLKACIDAAYSAVKRTISDLPDVSEGLLADIDDKSVWVAEKDGATVGVMVLNPADDYLALENIAVHPDASGSGIGKRLIGLAESECSRRLLPEIRLSTHTTMPGNVRLYEHLGWRVSGIVGNKVHMTKRIEPNA